MDTLPLEVELRAATDRVAVNLIVAGVMIFFAYKGINAVPADILGPYGSTARWVVRIGFAAGGLLIAGKSLVGVLFSSTRYTIDTSAVVARERSVTGSGEWTEALDRYEGVRWRRVRVLQWTPNSSSRSRNRYRQVIELAHPETAKTVPLFLQMSGKPGLGVAMEAMKLAREAESASPEERRELEEEIARLGDMTSAGDPRERWTALAELLGLPKLGGR